MRLPPYDSQLIRNQKDELRRIPKSHFTAKYGESHFALLPSSEIKGYTRIHFMPFHTKSFHHFRSKCLAQFLLKLTLVDMATTSQTSRPRLAN
ncbi:hypothetical protein CEXT_158551 [Caerostris extrusa]|uniref:Uncharacterized protein n=1 Tax=Caerostris extrusa TaxID=172846 RepID=A0AAV4UN92_CAEEX|nr:hypothetical protein CEXT_158551 [Caerostris extrusa]